MFRDAGAAAAIYLPASRVGGRGGMLARWPVIAAVFAAVIAAARA